MGDNDRELVSEFAAAIADMGGPDGMAKQLAVATGWVEAFRAVCDAAEPPDETANKIVRAVFVAMRERGIDTMWPLRFGDMP